MLWYIVKANGTVSIKEPIVSRVQYIISIKGSRVQIYVTTETGTLVQTSVIGAKLEKGWAPTVIVVVPLWKKSVQAQPPA